MALDVKSSCTGAHQALGHEPLLPLLNNKTSAIFQFDTNNPMCTSTEENSGAHKSDTNTHRRRTNKQQTLAGYAHVRGCLRLCLWLRQRTDDAAMNLIRKRCTVLVVPLSMSDLEWPENGYE